jgi:lysozyme
LKFEVIDGCPVPAEIAPQVRLLKHDVPHAVLQSAYRGNAAAGLLKRLHKKTQAMLYWGFLHHLPGYNPANRPGQSTHELFAGGAYRGPKTRPIRAWGCGLDWNDAAVDELIAAAKRRGWEMWRPYPAGSERHHLNFRRKPKLVVPVHKPQPTDMRVVSWKAIDTITGFEGCRLAPYQDAVGVWTIGFGHTKGVTAKTKPLTSIVAAKLLLHKDLEAYERSVAKLVRVPISQEQFDALVSFAYNVGTGALASSTLLKRLNSKHYGMAANQFLVWNKATMPNGKVITLPGLTRRRKAERQLFLAGSNQKTRAGAVTGLR